MEIKLIEGLSLIYMHRNCTGLYQVLQTKCSFKKTLIPLKLSVSLLSVHLWSTKAGESLRECLCKSGLVDFACDTDFAHFLCVVIHSCTYTKTTVNLIGSLYFSEFTEIKFHSSEGLS